MRPKGVATEIGWYPAAEAVRFENQLMDHFIPSGNADIGED